MKGKKPKEPGKREFEYWEGVQPFSGLRRRIDHREAIF
jgi:hypothetical protein